MKHYGPLFVHESLARSMGLSEAEINQAKVEPVPLPERLKHVSQYYSHLKVVRPIPTEKVKK